MIKLLPLLLLLAAPLAAASPFPFAPVSLDALSEMPVSIPEVRLSTAPLTRDFNEYILKAVKYLNANYRLRGYDIKAVLTHDTPYNDQGLIAATKAPRTMCVAAVMEVMLTAYDIYQRETGDSAPYTYLPKESYEGLSAGDIKGHIWVNAKLNSYGTADALINFGMGERRTFEDLKPGDFVNLNRTNKTGHAVIFLGYINKKGEILPAYDAAVVGFKYFSSQGRYLQGFGGFDHRFAVFSQFGCPLSLNTLGKRDCKVIYSNSQKMLNTGRMLAPQLWTRPAAPPKSGDTGETVFDGTYFNGLTTDD